MKRNCTVCDKVITLVNKPDGTPVYYMHANGRMNWYCGCTCGVFHKENNYMGVLEILMDVVNEEEIEKFLRTYKK